MLWQLRGGRGVAGLIPGWSALCADSAAMLEGQARRGTRCALRASLRQPRRVSLRSALRAPASPPALLATPQIAPPHRARHEAGLLARHWSRTNVSSAKLRGWACGLGGACEAPSSARASVGARSALRALTHCGCLSGAHAVRAASSAVRPTREQRRAVAAGDRFSEAPKAACPPPRLCREVQKYKQTGVNPCTN